MTTAPDVLTLAAAPDVLTLAAFDPELVALRAGIGADGRVGRLSVAASPVGIGLVAAALGAAAAIAPPGPRGVVLVGTCGAYAGAMLRVGDVVVARRVALVDPCACTGAAAFPAHLVRTIDADEALARGLADAGARPVDVATTLAITVDDAAAALIEQRTGAGVEHLEAFAVAAACAGRVPFAAVLGVANLVGSRGREEWRHHHRGASDAAGRCVLDWIHAGARGLAPRPEAPASAVRE